MVRDNICRPRLSKAKPKAKVSVSLKKRIRVTVSLEKSKPGPETIRSDNRCEPRPGSTFDCGRC